MKRCFFKQIQLLKFELALLFDAGNGNTLSPTNGQNLGMNEGIELPVWEITEWVEPGAAAEIGGRQLTLINTPGHSDNSVSRLDEANNLMFSGDFAMRGNHTAFMPRSSMDDDLQSSAGDTDL
nr:hypothetical protein [uncultured Shimia sp.]